MDKILYHRVHLRCGTAEAFDMFTLNEHLGSWLCPAADVEPVAGGKYELFWNPEDRDTDSTLGCRVTAVEPGVFISFEWKGPGQFSGFMNDADPLTHVTVFFRPRDDEDGPASGTDVYLLHSVWRSTARWEKAR